MMQNNKNNENLREQGLPNLKEAAACNAEEDARNEMLTKWLPIRGPAGIAYDNSRRLWQRLGKHLQRKRYTRLI